MKKLIILLAVVFALCFAVVGLAGCGGNSPERTVETALDAFKSQDWETFTAQYTGDTIVGRDDFGMTAMTAETLAAGLGVSTEVAQSYIDAWVNGVEYSVIDSNIEGDVATVTVELTVLDIIAINDQVMQDFAARMADDPETYAAMSQAELTEQMVMAEIEGIAGAERTEPFTVEVVLAKVDGTWMINDDSLTMGIFPGTQEPQPQVDDAAAEDAESAAVDDTAAEDTEE